MNLLTIQSLFAKKPFENTLHSTIIVPISCVCVDGIIKIIYLNNIMYIFAWNSTNLLLPKSNTSHYTDARISL